MLSIYLGGIFLFVWRTLFRAQKSDSQLRKEASKTCSWRTLFAELPFISRENTSIVKELKEMRSKIKTVLARRAASLWGK